MSEETFEQAQMTVDIVVFTIQHDELQVLLVQRKYDPYKGGWALPGGFIRKGEDLEHAARRELQEETNVKELYLEQLYTFGTPKRDPRGRIITVAYMALTKKVTEPIRAASDAAKAEWKPVHKLPELAFDHKKILDYALKRLKWKFEYTTAGFAMLPKQFTLRELQAIYETVFNKTFDKRNFTKKILSLDILEEAGLQRNVPYRPPMTYSLKKGLGEIVEIL